MQKTISLPIPSASAARAGHIAGLDGLRAVAVGLVLVYHLFPGVLPGGFIGVDVFFVISGFLITTLLLRERSATGRIDLIGFWRRRVRRLLPAMAAVVLVTGAVAALIGGDVLVGLWHQVLGALTFSYNWTSLLFDSSYFDQTSPDLLRNMWSLAIEEQFYIVWPLLFLAAARFGGRLSVAAVSIVFAAGSTIWMLRLAPAAGQDPTRVYFGTDTHAFGLALGCALACVLLRRNGTEGSRSAGALGIFGLAALPVLSVVIDDTSTWTYPWGLLAASAAAVAAITAGVLNPRFGALVDAAPLRWVGIRSYGIYLWHWPLLVLADELLRGRVPSLVIGTAVLLASLLLAEASHRWIEQPFRRHGFRVIWRYNRLAWVGATRSRWRALGFSVLAAAAAVTLAGGLMTAPVESRAASVISTGQEQLSKPTPPSAPEQTPGLPAVPTPSAESAVLDITSDGSNVTAIGDSVMLASVPALQRAMPHIQIDAAVSRNFADGLDIAEDLKREGALRDHVVLGLVTNGVPDDADLERLEALAAEHRIVLVSAYADRSWVEPANESLRAFAEAHRGRVALADWEAVASDSHRLLAPDLIHPEPAGATAYTDQVSEALEALTMIERGFKPHRPVAAPAEDAGDGESASPAPTDPADPRAP